MRRLEEVPDATQIRLAPTGAYLARRRCTNELGFRIASNGTPAACHILAAVELDAVIAIRLGIDDHWQRTGLTLSTHTLGRTIETKPGLTAEFGE